MTLPGDYGILPLALVSCIGLIGVFALIFLSFKRYEVVIGGMLLTPWLHWIFVTNAPEAETLNLHAGIVSYLRVGFVLVLGMVGYFNFIRLRLRSLERVPFRFKLLMVFLCYALLSTLYSIDSFYTLSRSVEFIAFFGFLLGLYYWLRDTWHLDKALNTYFVIMALGIIVNLASFVLFPGRVWWWRSATRFQGITHHPNVFGAFCMMSYPIFMWKYNRVSSRNKFWIALLLCVTLILHLLSGSRTSLAASFFGLLVWHFVLNHKAILLMIVLMVMIGGLVLVQAKPSSFNRPANKLTDLTGRAGFWRGCMVLIKERPLWGYGYEVEGKVWSDPRFTIPGVALWSGSARSSLHNGYLNTAIGLGLVGILLWLVCVAIPLCRLAVLKTNVYKALAVVVAFQALLVNFFETDICGSRTGSSIIFWCMWIICGKLWLMQPKARYSQDIEKEFNDEFDLCSYHSGAQ